MSDLLKRNPFFLLSINMDANRSEIISRVQEMTLFDETSLYEDAQTTLLTPTKRLFAEISWFPEAEESIIKSIEKNIKGNTCIGLDELTGLSRLNAILYNFTIESFSDHFELGYYLLDIDENYNKLNSNEITNAINLHREKSKTPASSVTDIDKEISEYRYIIRKLINSKVLELIRADYIELVNMIAEKCISNEQYNDGIILSDIIDQYEINLQSEIESASKQIDRKIQNIKSLDDETEISLHVSDLVNIIKDWDEIVQPLQLLSQNTGIMHEESAVICRNVRDLAIWLHNEKGLSDISLSLINEMKSVFEELIDLSSLLEADSEQLLNMIDRNKAEEELLELINELEKDADNLKTYATDGKISSFISKIQVINKKISDLSLDRKLDIQLRESVCCIARDVAITLHNEKHMTSTALKLATFLETLYGHLPNVGFKLKEDVYSLDKQAFFIETQKKTEEKFESIKFYGLIAVAFIILVGFAVFAVMQTTDGTSDNSTPSTSYSTDSHSSYYDTNVTYSKTLSELKSDIEDMESQLEKMKSNVHVMESDLDALSDDIDYYERQYYSTGNEFYYDYYYDAVDEYNALYDDYSYAIDEYNDLYDEYSSAIDEYNSRIN